MFLATLHSKLSIKVAKNKRGEKKFGEGKAKKVVLKAMKVKESKKKKAGEF